MIGSRAELEDRAVGGLDQLEELRRPWIDAVPIRCESCGEEVHADPGGGRRLARRRHRAVLDAGLGEPRVVPGGYGTGAAKGLTTADLPDHAYWEQWFPADWVTEMREQIRLWFYSQLLMSVALVGRAPFKKVLGYEKMLDEHGREMHSSWGNTIDAHDAFARMGADVMRWQYCAQPPDATSCSASGRPTRSGGSCSRSGTRPGSWSTTATSPVSSRATPISNPGPTRCVPLDRWLVERTRRLVADATAAYESWLTVDVIRAFDDFVDDLSNWYIRRSRRRFWDGDETALRTLWFALVTGLRVVAPVLPFLSEHLWDELVGRPRDAPDSVFLAGWPSEHALDESLLAEVAQIRLVVALGHRARSERVVEGTPTARRLVVEGAPLAEAHAVEIADELRVEARRVRSRRRDRAEGEAEPAGARPEARRGARAPSVPRSRPGSSRSSETGASGRSVTTSGRTT